MADYPRAVPDRDAEDPDGDRPVDDADALVPAEIEPVSPPPVDVDEREGHEPDDDPIAMPDAETAEQARRIRWNSSIDNLIPEPRDEPYHDDDDAGPDPYDARDEVDIHVPSATGDARDEVDDFSTEEELDVDNAPAGHNPEHRASNASPDRSPATGESVTYRFGRDAEDALPESEERVDAGMAAEAEPHEATQRLTTCPVCGQATEPLRFCGYCGSPLTEQRREITGDTPVQRLVSRAEGVLEPVAEWTRPGAMRAILAVGFLLVLVSLLANSGALALIIGASILPIAILYWCRKVDVVENEPWYIVVAFGVVGVVIGALLGWLAAFTTTTSWFETGVLNFGAAGFGGRFAEAAGAAPFIVWMIGGALVPLLALAAIVASPLLARRFAPLGNEVMDGLTVAAAMGGGFAIGTAAVFVAPMFGQPGPSISPSAWTLTTIGLTIVRPLIWTLAGGMIGAGAWRYLFTGKLTTAIAPVGLGVLGPLLFALLSLQLQPVGLWAEVLAGVIIAAVVAALYARTLSEAILEDRKVLGADEARVVCPHCHRVTPEGQFCAHCGEEIASAAADA
jgi:hypothetical protein